MVNESNVAKLVWGQQFRDHFSALLGSGLVFGYGHDGAGQMFVLVSCRADLSDEQRFPQFFSGKKVEYRVLNYPPKGVNL